MTKIKRIIVEGSDGSGKSSLIKHIDDNFGLKTWKESLSYKDRLKPNYNGYNYYKELLGKLPENIICDRLHIGEIVNPIIRKDGRTPLTLKQLQEIEEPIKNDSLLIACLPSEEFTKKVFLDRGEEVAEIKDIKYLHYLYNLFFTFSSIKNKLIFDVEKDSEYKVIDMMLKGYLK